MDANTTPVLEFSLGQIVCLKSNPSIRGAVVAVSPGTPENRFNVFLNGNVQNLLRFATASWSAARWSLSRGCQATRSTPISPRFTSDTQSYPRFIRLTRQASTSSPISTGRWWNSSRLNYRGYLSPIASALEKPSRQAWFCENYRHAARLNPRSLSAPRPLVAEKKWEQEMKRFDENFTPLDGKNLAILHQRDTPRRRVARAASKGHYSVFACLTRRSFSDQGEGVGGEAARACWIWTRPRTSIWLSSMRHTTSETRIRRITTQFGSSASTPEAAVFLTRHANPTRQSWFVRVAQRPTSRSDFRRGEFQWHGGAEPVYLTAPLTWHGRKHGGGRGKPQQN